MRKKLFLWLSVFMAITSVGWLHAEGDGYTAGTLGDWGTDRTEPQSWDISSGGWITFSTKTEPNNNWYSWHGKKTSTDMTTTNDWVVETQLKLTEDLLKRDGVRTSVWLNVFNDKNTNADWAIIQFNIDNSTKTKGWQVWDSKGDGSWINVTPGTVPVTADTYTIKMAFRNGRITQYINDVEVHDNEVTGSKISSVKEVIFNSYSFGESYSTTWKVPTLQYVKGVAGVSTSEELKAAVANKDISSIQLTSGSYIADLTIDRPLTLTGAGSGDGGTTIKGILTVTASGKAKVNLSGLHLTPDNTETGKHAIIVGTTLGKQNPVLTLTDCKLDKANRGINILGAGAELALKNTDINVLYYGLSLMNKQQTISIEDGTIQGWAAIMTGAAGLDEGLQTGKLASTDSKITISGAELISALISNENYGVIVLQEKYNGVTVNIGKSTLKAIPQTGYTPQYSSVFDVRSYGNKVTVTDSHLYCENGANEAGGAILSLGWCHADFGKEFDASIHFSQVKDYSTPTQNKITISGSEVKMKEGEKSVVTQRIAKNQTFDHVSINGTAYSVEDGNVYRINQYAFVGNKEFEVDDNGAPMASDGAALKDLVAAAADGTTISLQPITYTLNESLKIAKSITLKGLEKSKLVFSTGGLVVDADNVNLAGLNVTATTGNALSVNAGKKGITIENGSYTNVVEGKQGEGAIRFVGNNGDINVSGATLKGGIHILDYTGGELSGITKNTITIEGTPTSTLSGIIVAGIAGKVSAIELPALALYKQQTAITMPATGAQCDVLYQNTGAAPWAAVDGVATPGTAAELSAIAAFDSQLTILLEAKAYEFSSRLDITKSVKLIGSISGQDTTSIIAKDWKTDNSDQNKNTLIEIAAANVTLSDLNIKNSERNGINVFSSTGILLDNVTVQNSKAAGLVVNGSTVTATNFRTSGNAWYGVNVDKGKGVAGTPLFTIGTGCSFGEKVAVCADMKNDPDGDVSKYVVGGGWVMIKAAENGYYWANVATSGINLAITSIPATVVYGQANLPLIANVEKATIGISEFSEEGVIQLVSGDNDSKILKILKPGKAILTVSAGDMSVQQAITVLKKNISIAGIKAVDKTYNGSPEITLDTKSVEVKGLVGEDKADAILIIPSSGNLTSSQAGSVLPVKVAATLKSKSDYYTLDSIIGVTATVKKKDLTVTAVVPENENLERAKAINFGSELPVFTATYSGFIESPLETVADLGGTLQFDCPVSKTTLAGTYKVTPYGYTSPNYNIRYATGELEVKAIAPVVSIENVKVNTISTGNSSVTATGRITSNGGTETTTLTGGFTAGDKTVTGLTVTKDGTFAATITGLANKETEVKATAKATGDLAGISTAGISVNLSLSLQNVNFASVLSRLIYNTEAALSAKDYADGATVTFISSDETILKVTGTTVKALKVGEATLTVTAVKDGYLTATAKQTVTVEPKNLTLQKPVISRAYNGTTDATLPEINLAGEVGSDDVKVDASKVTARFIDKNVGSKAVLLSGDFTLTGAAAANYTLTQPTAWEGTITTGGKVTATVSNVHRKYNETVLKYDLSFRLADGTELLNPAYTGSISVVESNGGAYTVSSSAVIPNYDKVALTSESGTVDIKRGTPRVIIYSDEHAGNSHQATATVLDAEGWGHISGPVYTADDNNVYATFTYGDGESVRTASIAKGKSKPSIDWGWTTSSQGPAKHNLMTRAATVTPDQTLDYGASNAIGSPNDFTLTTSNPAVITLTDGNVNAVGVGMAAIIATHTSGAVAILTVQVNPAVLTLKVENTDKAFDNTAASPVTLALAETADGAALDLDGLTFNYAKAAVGEKVAIIPSKPVTLKGDNASNYRLKEVALEGKINPRDLTVTSPINKYYDGTSTLHLSGYSAEGLIEGEAAPALVATFEEKDVETALKVALAISDGNYRLQTPSDGYKGTIVRSTMEATLPQKATGPDKLKAAITLLVRETNTPATANIAYEPSITESNGKYYVSGGDNDNYAVAYTSNSVTKTSTPPINPPDEPEDVAVSTVELDIVSKTLPRTESFVLTATLNKGEEAPANKTITWKSSDETIAKVESTGDFTAKVTALAFGEATITVTTEDGLKTAECAVSVDFATSLEEAIANTRIYAKEGTICIEPVMPMEVMVVNMVGQTVYKNEIQSTIDIPVSASGIYIVKLGKGNDAKVHKVNVN